LFLVSSACCFSNRIEAEGFIVLPDTMSEMR
jgi:hypothetical protein